MGIVNNTFKQTLVPKVLSLKVPFLIFGSKIWTFGEKVETRFSSIEMKLFT
jgi:hypothetical protein